MIDNELTIIGIIPETDLQGRNIAIRDLKRIFYDALAIGPLYEPLIRDLDNKKQI